MSGGSAAAQCLPSFAFGIMVSSKCDGELSLNPEQLDDLANTSRALLVAISEGQELLNRRAFGAGLDDVLQHARDLLDILRDDLGADGGAGDFPLSLIATIEAKLDAIALEIAAFV